MSNAAAKPKIDVRQFGENAVRLEIALNSLRALSDKIAHTVETDTDTVSLVAFFEDELPDLMRRNGRILTQAIGGSGAGTHEAAAALDMMREDHERLATLATTVLAGLRPSPRAADDTSREALRSSISAYCAALRSHMGWARKFVSGERADPAALP